MATDPGYGYFRPSINLFDPGWRLTPDGHDTGTHAAAVMDRQAYLLETSKLSPIHTFCFLWPPEMAADQSQRKAWSFIGYA